MEKHFKMDNIKSLRESGKIMPAEYEKALETTYKLLASLDRIEEIEKMLKGNKLDRTVLRILGITDSDIAVIDSVLSKKYPSKAISKDKAASSLEDIVGNSNDYDNAIRKLTDIIVSRNLEKDSIIKILSDIIDKDGISNIADKSKAIKELMDIIGKDKVESGINEIISKYPDIRDKNIDYDKAIENISDAISNLEDKSSIVKELSKVIGKNEDIDKITRGLFDRIVARLTSIIEISTSKDGLINIAQLNPKMAKKSLEDARVEIPKEIKEEEIIETFIANVEEINGKEMVKSFIAHLKDISSEKAAEQLIKLIGKSKTKKEMLDVVRRYINNIGDTSKIMDKEILQYLFKTITSTSNKDTLLSGLTKFVSKDADKVKIMEKLFDIVSKDINRGKIAKVSTSRDSAIQKLAYQIDSRFPKIKQEEIQELSSAERGLLNYQLEENDLGIPGLSTSSMEDVQKFIEDFAIEYDKVVKSETDRVFANIEDCVPAKLSSDKRVINDDGTYQDMGIHYEIPYNFKMLGHAIKTNEPQSYAQFLKTLEDSYFIGDDMKKHYLGIARSMDGAIKRIDAGVDAAFDDLRKIESLEEFNKWAKDNKAFAVIGDGTRVDITRDGYEGYLSNSIANRLSEYLRKRNTGSVEMGDKVVLTLQTPSGMSYRYTTNNILMFPTWRRAVLKEVGGIATTPEKISYLSHSVEAQLATAKRKQFLENSLSRGYIGEKELKESFSMGDE